MQPDRTTVAAERGDRIWREMQDRDTPPGYCCQAGFVTAPDPCPWHPEVRNEHPYPWALVGWCDGEPPPAPAGDILSRIDATVEAVESCGCGCGRRLDPSGPSPFFASDACQRRYHERHATNPREVLDRPDADLVHPETGGWAVPLLEPGITLGGTWRAATPFRVGGRSVAAGEELDAPTIVTLPRPAPGEGEWLDEFADVLGLDREETRADYRRLMAEIDPPRLPWWRRMLRRLRRGA